MSLDDIFKQLCLCTSSMSFMLVRRRMSKAKIEEIIRILEGSVSQLKKLL